jgi:glucose/arabinose dehydrogenase
MPLDETCASLSQCSLGQRHARGNGGPWPAWIASAGWAILLAMGRVRAAAPVALFFALWLLLSGCSSDEELPFGLASQVAASADRATVMAFAPDGRIFFGEQFTGAIRIINAEGEAQADPFAQVETTSYIGQDWGLTGLAIDPAFETNHFVYAFYTALVKPADPPPADGSSPAVAPQGPIAKPILVRFRDDNGVGVELTVISDNFPETSQAHGDFNANGQIHFGPDGYLYVSVGDYDIFQEERDRVRRLDNPIGKLLRIDAVTGGAAPGNPFAADPTADPRVFAYGFREPFDFAFHPENGRIYGTDNTTVSCEELNIIEPGKDYSWPDVGTFPFADCTAGAGVDAIHIFAKEGVTPSEFLGSFVEVSGIDFVSGDEYAQLGDGLLVCELGTGVLRRLVLSGPNFDQVAANDVLTTDCKRDVSVAPDGTIYYATDSEIRRLVASAAASEIPATRAP